MKKINKDSKPEAQRLVTKRGLPSMMKFHAIKGYDPRKAPTDETPPPILNRERYHDGIGSLKARPQRVIWDDFQRQTPNGRGLCTRSRRESWQSMR